MGAHIDVRLPNTNLFRMINPGLEPTTPLTVQNDAHRMHQLRASLASATPEGMIRLLVELNNCAQQRPHLAESWVLLGDAYIKLSQPYAAEKAYARAISLDENDAKSREGMGLALLQTSRQAQAARQFAIAHELAPNNAEILVHWGLAMMQQGQMQLAHRRFLLASQTDVRNAHAMHNLGIVDLQRDMPHSALKHLQAALLIDPAFVSAHLHSAIAHRQLNQLPDALSDIERALQLAPRNAEALMLQAELALDAGQLDNAKLALDSLIKVTPNAPEVYVALSRLYAMHGQIANAKGVLETALALRADDPSACTMLAQLHLAQGDWSTGWLLYEARRKLSPSPVRDFPFPEWQGESLAGKTILVHAEQGLGTTILFSHWLQALIDRAGHVLVEVPTELAALMSRSFPQATVIGRHPRWSRDAGWMHERTPSIAYQLPMGSLPFRSLDRATIPKANSPHLMVDPIQVAAWRDKRILDTRPAIGIAWQGGLLQNGRVSRSLSLAELASAFADLPFQWISLQHDVPGQLLAAESARLGWDLQHWTEAFQDIDSLASLTASLDAVVTVCGTQAHVTGGVGRPGFVLAPVSSPWCYGVEGETLPWYPSLTVVRQMEPLQWGPVLTSTAQLLRERFNACASIGTP